MNTGVIERTAPNEVRVRRALLSVSDKTGLLDFARGLQELGVELVSTGGTARELSRADIAAARSRTSPASRRSWTAASRRCIRACTRACWPAATRTPTCSAAAEHEIEPVDLVFVNLYPFEQTLARGDASEQEIIENIDIGGPTMIRAAAKNQRLRRRRRRPGRLPGAAGGAARARRAPVGGHPLGAGPKAFATTARYDAAISEWFARSARARASRPAGREAYEKVLDLRYGENPHQAAPSTRAPGPRPTCSSGVNQLPRQGAVVQQPARPQLRPGAGRRLRRARLRDRQAQQPLRLRGGRQRREAYARAFACDPQSAYGGVIALNRPVDGPPPRAVRPVHRGAARALLRATRRSRSCREEERPPARARRLAPRAASASRPPCSAAMLCRPTTRSPRRASR